MKQILDKAEVALEYPDKFYSGTFERSSRFEARFDPVGVGLVLEHPGDSDVRKSVHIHVNYGLLAEIFAQLAASASRIPADEPHRAMLAEQLTALHRAVSGTCSAAMKIAACLSTLLAALAATTSDAAAGDAGNGKILAERWCQTCHAIAANQPMEVTEAPACASIARKPGFDEARVATFLLAPHPKMPDIGLGRDAAADLAAFIASFK